jgi:hypothetical protein
MFENQNRGLEWFSTIPNHVLLAAPRHRHALRKFGAGGSPLRKCVEDAKI